MSKKNFKKLDRLLEIPNEVYTTDPKISITGFEELILENFIGILEYEQYLVKIKTHIGILSVNGYNLKLENMTNDDIKVRGKIENIEFERIVEES